MTFPSFRVPTSLSPGRPDRVLRHPGLLAHELDVDRGLVYFAPMSRRTYRASSYLDHRLVSAPGRRVAVPIATLVTRSQETQAPRTATRFLFHTAFCGSTFLSRALDVRGVCLAYKEPGSLHQTCRLMADQRRASEPSTQDWGAFLPVLVRLLSKTYYRNEAALIKPKNFDNASIPALLTTWNGLQPNGLLLYSDLETYLCGVLKSPGRRAWARRCMDIITRFAPPSEVLAKPADGHLSDGQVAAWTWLWQIHNFYSVREQVPRGALRTLNCKHLFARPAATIAAVASFYDLALSPGFI